MNRLRYAILIVVTMGCNSPINPYKNVNNIRNINVGMTVHEVYEIMGEPDSVFVMSYESERIRLLYESPVGASDHIYVYLSKNDSVVIGVNDGS